MNLDIRVDQSLMSNPPYVFSRRQHYLLCHIVQSEHSVKFQMFIISLTDIVSSLVPGLFWIIDFLTDHAGIPGTVCK